MVCYIYYRIHHFQFLLLYRKTEGSGGRAQYVTGNAHYVTIGRLCVVSIDFVCEVTKTHGNTIFNELPIPIHDTYFVVSKLDDRTSRRLLIKTNGTIQAVYNTFEIDAAFTGELVYFLAI